jgi:hypothetical protein
MGSLSDILSIAGALTGNVWLISAAFASRAYDAKVERRRVRARFNDAQVDRLEMIDLTPDAPRHLVLGRVRFVEGVRRKWRSGVHSEVLTMVVSFAGHRIDGFDQWYLDDTPVTLNGDGWVQTAPWAKPKRRTESVSTPIDGGGGGSAPLVMGAGETIVPGALYATWATGEGDNRIEGAASVTIVGSSAVISGAQPGTTGTVTYDLQSTQHLVRIRPYVGADAQNIGAELGAEYGGAIDSRHAFAGIACAVVDQIYDPDVFPSGRATVSAVFRGARCYDPRQDSTAGGSGSQRIADPTTWAWSENPAVCALRYALWENGWALPADEVPLADVRAAADVCDVSTLFTLRKPDGSTSGVTLPRHRCGIAIPADESDRRPWMDEIFEAMAGRWGWAGGQWRLRAGAMKPPAFTLAPGWVAQRMGDDGEPVAGAWATVTTGVPRDQQINRVTGKCVDPDQRWQDLPYPAASDAVLIATKGLRPVEINLEAVSHPAHAQHLGTVTIRHAQAGLRMVLACNLHAWRTELLDVGAMDLPRYGMPAAAGKTMEVTGWRWQPTEGVQLTLEEISAEIFTPVAELTGRDPAPNGVLRRPWQVEDVLGLTIHTGVATLADGSVITRTEVTWTPPLSETLRVGGGIDIQYTLASAAPPPEWPSWPEEANGGKTVIPGLLAGRYYLFRARYVQRSPLVRGPWARTVIKKTNGVPLVDTGGLNPSAATEVIEFFDASGVAFSNLG